MATKTKHPLQIFGSSFRFLSVSLSLSLKFRSPNRRSSFPFHPPSPFITLPPFPFSSLFPLSSFLLKKMNQHHYHPKQQQTRRRLNFSGHQYHQPPSAPVAAYQPNSQGKLPRGMIFVPHNNCPPKQQQLRQHHGSRGSPNRNNQHQGGSPPSKNHTQPPQQQQLQQQQQQQQHRKRNNSTSGQKSRTVSNDPSSQKKKQRNSKGGSSRTPPSTPPLSSSIPKKDPTTPLTHWACGVSYNSPPPSSLPCPDDLFDFEDDWDEEHAVTSSQSVSAVPKVQPSVSSAQSVPAVLPNPELESMSTDLRKLLRVA